MTTLLVIDIGNTNVSLGIFDYADSGRGELRQHWRISTHREQTSDEVSLSVTALFQQAQRAPRDVTDVIISSVVPLMTTSWISTMPLGWATTNSAHWPEYTRA